MKRILFLLLTAAGCSFGQSPGASQALINGSWWPVTNLNAPYLVQSGPAASTGSSGLTVTSTLVNKSARGDTLVFACGGSEWAGSNWTAAVTDSQLNHWVQAGSTGVNSTTQWSAIFVAQSTLGGTADAITLTLSGSNASNQSIACYPYEFPGDLFPANPVDQSATANNAGSTSPSAGSVSPASTNEIAITAIAAGATSTPTLTAGSFWVLDSGTVAPASGSLIFGSESAMITSAPAAITGNATLSASNAWAAVVVTFGLMKNVVHVIPTGVAGTPATQVMTVQGSSSGTALPISGAVSQTSGPWTFNMTQIAGGVLGAMANYGSSPGAVLVPGVNAFVTNSPAVTGSGVFEVGPTAAANTVSNPFFTQLSNGTNNATFNSTTTSSKFGLDTNILSILGTAPTTAGFLDVKGADGNVFVRQTTGSNLHTVVDAGTALMGETVTMSTATTTDSALGCYVQGGTGTTASTNATNCKGSSGNFYGFRAINTTATLAYLRMYNSSSAPTCSSATGFIESIPIPASATGAGAIDTSNLPIGYSTGIGFCVTGGSGNTDNTNAPAGVFITLKYK